MNTINLLFYQNLSEQNRPLGYFFDLDFKTDDELSPLYLKLLASQELKEALDLLKHPYIASKTFDLRKPIFIEIRWNKELKLELAQVLVNRDKPLRKGLDFPYTIKKRQYLLIDKGRLSSYRANIVYKKPISHSNNLYRIYNTVEYQSGNPIKYANPVLYTGLIN